MRKSSVLRLAIGLVLLGLAGASVVVTASSGPAFAQCRPPQCR